MGITQADAHSQEVSQKEDENQTAIVFNSK